MKRIILSLVSLFFAFNLLAQEENHRNKFVLGGNIRFETQKNNPPNPYFYIHFNNAEVKRTTFFFNPYIGRELNEHLLFGFQMNYSTTETKYELGYNLSGLSNSESKMIGISIFSRYIFNPKNKVNFFLQASSGYNSLEKKLDDTLSPETFSETSLYLDAALRGGILVQITNRFYLTGYFGRLFYQVGETTAEVQDRSFIVLETMNSEFSTFGASLNVSTLSFGLEFQF